MKFYLTAILLLASFSLFAQKQNVYFLKDDGRYVTNRDSADFIRIVREPDSASTLYNIFEFYPNGTKKLVGKSSRIDPPKFEGPCVVYFKNGARKALFNYKNNLLSGAQYEYYPNGKIYIAKTYPEVKSEEYRETEDYLITDELDSLGAVLVKDGNGYYKGFDDKFKKVIDEGPIKDGKPEGQWKGTDEGMHLRFFENYSNGELVLGISVTDKGDTVKYTKARGTEPHYKGGLTSFYSYISNSVKYPDYEKEHNIHGKVILSFIVEKDGAITDIKVLSPVTVNIDNEAIRVLHESRKWIPGTFYGRPIRTQYTIPMDFSLTEE